MHTNKMKVLIRKYWDLGMGTDAIANILHYPESKIYNLLHVVREQTRARRLERARHDELMEKYGGVDNIERLRNQREDGEGGPPPAA